MHEWKYNLSDRPQIVANELGELSLDREEPNENLITWIFDEGSFVPSAKITKEDTFSIVSDYLGTPCLMYNSVGNLVWQADLDIYGKVRTLSKGNINDCPFRYQGQYHDTEVDLHYNRFRYYSLESGTYISQDPIGLKGGTNIYSYVHDVNNWVDLFGLAPWDKGGFDEWFNNASVKDIIDNKSCVSSALRGDGGMHEMFPVSQAAKAKQLGFTAEELKSMTVATDRITFVGVTDSSGNLLTDGAHHHSRAGRHFHNKLIADLQNATSKKEAMDIITTHHNNHMRCS